jgi:tRNA1(Val) A37 N6-methylase TrmN6
VTTVESQEFLGSYTLTQSDDYFKLGRDSVLLAAFATLRPGWQVCDLGCGVGSLLLLLSQREEKLDRTGIELNPGAAELARRNLAANQLPGTVLTGDLRDRTLLPGDRFHLVVSNPPYFRAGSGKSGGMARMDDTCSVEELCQAAGRLVRTGGRFALVYRPERLAELFAALAQARLTPKRMQLLSYHREKAPYAVLVEAVKEGGPGLDILPNHYQTEP